MTDYISREAFKTEIRRLSTHYLNEWDTLGVLAAADRIPAADVRPVEKAHFSLVDGYSITALGYDIKGLECSNCGATFIAQTWVQKFNFCPNCGADMRPEPPKEKPTCKDCQRECQMMGLDMEACVSYEPPKGE